MELMIVVAIIGIVAVIAMPTDRLQTREIAFQRFVADIEGSVTQARNLAIDGQTPTRVRFTQVSATVEQENWVGDTDGVTGTQWDEVNFYARQRVDGDTLGEDVCIRALFAGVQIPGEAADSGVTYPTDCMGDETAITFQPDGTFAVTGLATNGAGVTVAIAHTDGNIERLAEVQVFPGGLIRSFNRVQG